jgi:DNA-binding transcriptional ArsR family regulator
MPTAKRRPSLKTAIYEHIARIGQAASSPSRLELLELLAQGPRTVEALAQQTGQSLAATSHHLQVLRRARLVEAEKAGLYVTYRLADPQVETFLLEMRHLAEARLAEIEQITRTFLQTRGALEPVDNGELAAASAAVTSRSLMFARAKPWRRISRSHLGAARRFAEAPSGAAETARGRRVLPWAALRDGTRRGRSPAPEGLQARRLEQGCPSGAHAGGVSNPARPAARGGHE